MNNKLAVIYGGPSPEHDISILTGLQAAKILSSKYEVTNIYWSRDNRWFLVDNDLESKDFIENKDILKSISKNKGDLKIIGFAAETQDIKENAKKKLNEKNLDLIIANDVSDSSIGFDSDENEVYLITEKIEKKIEKISKKKLSRSIIEFIAKYL